MVRLFFISTFGVTILMVYALFFAGGDVDGVYVCLVAVLIFMGYVFFIV